ncbi:MAG: reverse transcriptase-like protein [Actinomycetota bacterium]
MKVVAFCDGGARGNPGPAGIGVSIKDARGKVVAEISEAIGHATNNVAEYTAVKRALERAAELGANEAEIVSDSKLLVEQLNGRYRVKNPTLQRLHAEVRATARGIPSVSYRHVRRERNRRADELVNVAIDAWLEAGGEAATPADPGENPLF